MNPILIAATVIVSAALISYSIAILTEQRRHLADRTVLTFLTVGVVLDITATTLMIIGSENPPWTVHGLLGYSSLTGMLIDAILIWRIRLLRGTNAAVPRSLHLFSRFAYCWWVLAFLTGGFLAMRG